MSEGRRVAAAGGVAVSVSSHAGEGRVCGERAVEEAAEEEEEEEEEGCLEVETAEGSCLLVIRPPWLAEKKMKSGVREKGKKGKRRRARRRTWKGRMRRERREEEGGRKKKRRKKGKQERTYPYHA